MMKKMMMIIMLTVGFVGAANSEYRVKFSLGELLVYILSYEIDIERTKDPKESKDIESKLCVLMKSACLVLDEMDDNKACQIHNLCNKLREEIRKGFDLLDLDEKCSDKESSGLQQNFELVDELVDNINVIAGPDQSDVWVPIFGCLVDPTPYSGPEYYEY